jgi:hypothetical protein
VSPIPPLFQASTQDDESVAQMVALLDVQDGLPSARRPQDWAIATAAVRPGDQVIDLGSGTGTMSRQLAGLVALSTSTDWPTARHIPAQVRRAGLTLDPDVGSSAFIFTSDMLLRSQVVQRAEA